ncbi:hypothetical protein FEM48_Zijuj05G0102700 [Ziziphus jujuba var. spinosa]|uniref:Uncharacterized protein n=1 Tax=Ziziphus jujuba var. spinosa TaxID=714518 RepID=A0A978VED6_ZIZJJ|nr:hypothetical protein FEM48_Zijuj05G0102700 [Ziziphus jujuba var. spinosa]
MEYKSRGTLKNGLSEEKGPIFAIHNWHRRSQHHSVEDIISVVVDDTEVSSVCWSKLCMIAVRVGNALVFQDIRWKILLIGLKGVNKNPTSLAAKMSLNSSNWSMLRSLGMISTSLTTTLLSQREELCLSSCKCYTDRETLSATQRCPCLMDQKAKLSRIPLLEAV